MINNYDKLNLNTWTVRLNKSKCICVFSPTFRLILKFCASDPGTQSALDTVRGLPSSVSLLQNSGYADGLTIGNTRAHIVRILSFRFGGKMSECHANRIVRIAECQRVTRPRLRLAKRCHDE